MTKRIANILLCSLAAALIMSGCGGSDSSLTKAEFIKQADAICLKEQKVKAAALEAYLLKVGVGPGKPMTLAQAEYQTKKVLMPPIRSMAEQINDLGAPDGEEDKVEAILTGVEQAIETSEKEAETRRKTGKVGAYNDPFEEVAKLSQRYGFNTCFINY